MTERINKYQDVDSSSRDKVTALDSSLKNGELVILERVTYDGERYGFPVNKYFKSVEAAIKHVMSGGEGMYDWYTFSYEHDSVWSSGSASIPCYRRGYCEDSDLECVYTVHILKQA